MRFMAATTLSKLSSGSPMPIITTLVMARSILAGTLPNDLLAIHTWPMTSAAVRSLLYPCLPVEQKLQPSAQPACEETHSVRRPFCGIYTVSTLRPARGHLAIHGPVPAARSAAHQPFAGAVAGNVFAHHFRSANFGRGLDLFTRGLADVAHGIEVNDAEVVNPLDDLTGTKAVLP